MSAFKLKYSLYGPRGILVEWPNEISSKIIDDIISFKQKITSSKRFKKTELIPAYQSLLIVYDNDILNINDETLVLKQLYNSEISKNNNVRKLWEIPVCYDSKFGVDLKVLSKAKKLSISEVIKLHTQPIYTIAFIGFLPGFLYLSGLDEQLFFDRKATPSLNVEKGAVAIGGTQTGIYPKKSPGGWHIIGNTPLNLFDITHHPPCVFNAGDQIKFVSVDFKTHQDILKKVEQ